MDYRMIFLGVLGSIALSMFASMPANAQSNPEPFRDCEACPLVKMVPPGKFRMGDLSSEASHNQIPTREVTIAKAFAVGVYEITYDEFDDCVADGGCLHRPDDGGWGRGQKPVDSVNWDDAQEYVRWLSSKTGEHYRLLTEAETEYVTRAGTSTQYPWGDTFEKGHASCQGCGNALWTGLTIGMFKPNAWGLYDTVGSRDEWVQDCWHDTYEGAPTDGSAWMDEDCERHVLRGGAWYGRTKIIRSSSRSRALTYERANVYGFRVAREISN